MKIAIANRKGGVGKSTTAAHLAAGLTELKQRVLLIDMGPQSQASKFFGIKPTGLSNVLEHGADPLENMHRLDSGLCILADDKLPGTERVLNSEPLPHTALSRRIEPIADRFDAIVIDTPPGLSTLAVAAMWAADRLLIPVQQEALAADGLRMFMDELRQLQQQAGREWPYMILPTMHDKRRKIHRQLLEAMQEQFGDRLQEPIPEATAISEAPAYGQTIYQYRPKHDAALAYARLCGVYYHAG